MVAVMLYFSFFFFYSPVHEASSYNYGAWLGARNAPRPDSLHSFTGIGTAVYLNKASP